MRWPYSAFLEELFRLRDRAALAEVGFRSIDPGKFGQCMQFLEVGVSWLIGVKHADSK